MKILDHGEVEFIESWGSDERIIESARMSTGGGFKGWGGGFACPVCMQKFNDADTKAVANSVIEYVGNPSAMVHVGCGGLIERVVGDEKLLAYLWNNQHTTPFEMAGATFEIEAPIFVFREWHRHRTQSYSEASARYIPLANKNYMPTLERIRDGVAAAKGNRQAQGAVKLDESWAAQWLERLQEVYDHAQSVYELGINSGVPKELARLCVPVARYSRMRASTDLLNWLKFLKLRQAPGAQYEIRMYADAVYMLLCEKFPRTMALYDQTK